MPTATAAPVKEMTGFRVDGPVISDTKLIAANLLEGLSATEKMAQLKALSEVDRAQLGSGLRNGTWTYDD